MENTRRALSDYDMRARDRERAWETVTTDVDVASAAQADRAALKAVRDAFYVDTMDRNTRENCEYATLAFIRRVAKAD